MHVFGEKPAQKASVRQDAALNLSCIVCAYNEAGCIADVLRVVYDHPEIAEVIVVDDGSGDDTANIARAFDRVKVISYPINRGKSYAISQGVALATGDHILLIDADLQGLTADHIHALIAPVASKLAHVSLSLRANSLTLYRSLGLDFVSGERVVPASLLKPHIKRLAALPSYGAEVFMNQLVTEAGLSIAVVDWPMVRNRRKSEKQGHLRGLAGELAMTLDMFRVLSPMTILIQNFAMLRLKRLPARNRRHIEWL